MSSEVEEVVLPEALEQARAQATEQGLPYAGGVRPTVAWALVQGGHATLVDVRSGEERKFVGHVEGSQHVAWATGTAPFQVQSRDTVSGGSWVNVGAPVTTKTATVAIGSSPTFFRIQGQ